MLGRNGHTLLVCLALSVCVAAPLFAGTAPTIQNMVNEVSQSQYTSYQLSLQNMGLGLYDARYNQGFRSRAMWSSGSELGNQETRAYLVDQFSSMGMNARVQGIRKNVIGELTGTVTPENVYIVSGHFDTDRGSHSSPRPGGDDNASGVAGVLEAARVLSQYQFNSTILFIGWNGEEHGEWGSKDYVNTIAKNAWDAGHQEIKGMMALDMILRPGNDADPGAPIDLDVITESNQVCTDWANTFIAAANTYVPTLTIDSNQPYTDTPRGTDHKPFYDAGYAAFWLGENTLPELLNGANAHYHKSTDASDSLANYPNNPSGVVFDYPFATDTVRATVATIAQEAQIVPEPATLALLTVGGLGLLRRKRRSCKSQA